MNDWVCFALFLLFFFVPPGFIATNSQEKISDNRCFRPNGREIEKLLILSS